MPRLNDTNHKELAKRLTQMSLKVKRLAIAGNRHGFEMVRDAEGFRYLVFGGFVVAKRMTDMEIILEDALNGGDIAHKIAEQISKS